EDTRCGRSRGAASGTGPDRGPEPYRLCSQGKHRGDACAIHDAAGGYDWNLDVAHDHAHQCEGASHRFVRIAQVASAVSSGFGSLRDDEIQSQRFQAPRFSDAVRAAADLHAQGLDAAHTLLGQVAKVECEYRGPDLVDG